MMRLPEIHPPALINGLQKGFTLIEMLIALSILSIGLLSLAELQIIAIKSNKHSKELTSAVILAETTLEGLKKSRITKLSNGIFQDTNNPVNETGGTGGIFTRSWTIADYKGSTNMKKITATIEWPGPKGIRSISLDTVLSDVAHNIY